MKITFEHFQSSQGLFEIIVINPLKGRTSTAVTFIGEYSPPPAPVSSAPRGKTAVFAGLQCIEQ